MYKENEIAYQIGNITEILSRGRLCATPHCVCVRSHSNIVNSCYMNLFLEYIHFLDIWEKFFKFHTCFLQAPIGEKATGLERSTFALFMQPDWFVSKRKFAIKTLLYNITSC